MHALLDELSGIVEGARSMPMSASCVINRTEVLALLQDVRAQLPQALVRAQEVLGDRDAVLEDGRREAERVLALAARERHQLLAQTDLIQEAEAEAARVLEDARELADAMRAEVEDYVDGKLANFEIVLGKTLEAVERGRRKLSGRHELDDLREDASRQHPLDA